MKRLVLALLLTFAPALLAQEHHEPGAGAAGHGEAASSAEHHDDGLAVWKWVNFGLLAALLVWAIARNAPPFFAARIAEIQEDINEAKEVRAEADARAAAIEKRLANLDTELASLRTDAKREMEAEAARFQEETRRVAARSGEQAEQEIASLAKTAESDLRREASRLALALAEQKLKARMSPAAEGSLVEKFVAGLRTIARN